MREPGSSFDWPLSHPAEPGIRGFLQAAFSFNGQQLVTTGMDGTVQVVNTEHLGNPSEKPFRHDQDPRGRRSRGQPSAPMVC